MGAVLVSRHKSDQLRLMSRNFANRDMEKQSSVVALCFNQQPLVFRPGNSLTKSGEFLENGVSSSGPDEGL